MTSYRTDITINLGALKHNLEVLRATAPGCAVCGVVKSNAYGHGLVPVGKALAEFGIEHLAVFDIDEGISLRDAGVTIPILVFCGDYDGHYEELIAHKLTPIVFRPEHLAGLASAQRDDSSHSVHLKIDTGMIRAGVRAEVLSNFLRQLKAYPSLHLAGVMTHFANADLADFSFNESQLATFEKCHQEIEQAGFTPDFFHVANSAASLTFDRARRGMIRPGLALYGIHPTDAPDSQLKPILTWTTRPININTIVAGTRVSYGGTWTAQRTSTIATLPVGYADGYRRVLSNRAEVLVKGIRAPVVGNVCMNHVMVDITNVPQVSLNDEFVLLGSQGEQTITAWELARHADTIPYEITCGLSPHVQRRYFS